MTIGTLKSPNPRNRNLINTLLAILKVTEARRDVILAGGLYHRFPWTHPPPPPSCQLLEDFGVTNNDRHLEFYQELAHLVKTARTGTFCA